jgi:hypothetical protein
VTATTPLRIDVERPAAPPDQGSSTEIRKLWSIVSVGADSVLELRCLWPKGISGARRPITKHFRVIDFSGIEACQRAFEQAALEYNALGYNIYTVMNPIRPDFSGPGAAKDSDIRRRDLLLIDVDRVGDNSSPANQAELDAARALTDQIRGFMATWEWPNPIRVMSGNGYHLYYRLGGLENNKRSDELVRKTLRFLAACFKNALVEVDRTVYNAARITKVPGTLMRKGGETEDRPYRMAVVCDED